MFFAQQLCENTQTDTFTDSREEISSSPGDLAAVDEQNEGLLKIIKVEEAEEDLGKTTEHRTCLFCLFFSFILKFDCNDI